MVKKIHRFGLRKIMDIFDVGPEVAFTALAAASIILLISIFYFVHSAPPTSLTITSGPEGSASQKNALKYAKILEGNGVKVKVLTSKGSIENLQRLMDPKSKVDLGIVQGGINIPGIDKLISLGSISYQPLLVFYRGSKHLELLSDLKGKKIAIGPVGSGTRNFALQLLLPNGIKENEGAELLDLDADEASQALTDHKIDAAFVMSESASSDIMHKLLRSSDIHLYNFKQASAYSRKIENLNRLEFPEGSIDLGLDIPPHDVSLLGPMVELIAIEKLHPALSDLILEAATQVHNHPGIFQHRGEFPTPIEHDIKISEDASRFYKSGKSFFYRYLPFWLASLMSRIVVVFIPTLVVLIPVLRSIPAFFRWRVQTRIRQRYRDLLALEQRFIHEKDASKQEALRKNFDRIEDAVNKMKIKAAFADQFYGLRGHIDYVRNIVAKKQA